MVTTGAYIAARRMKLRLTQEELSERLKGYGVDRAASTLANWEADRGSIPIEIIPALAKALEEPSPVTLYELTRVLENIPGNTIVKLLDGKSPTQIETAERIVRAYLENK